MAKLIARIDPTLQDYIEAAARAERVPIDEYAGALLQVGWDALFGFRRSDRLPRAAAASRQAEGGERSYCPARGSGHKTARRRDNRGGRFTAGRLRDPPRRAAAKSYPPIPAISSQSCRAARRPR